MSNSDEIRNLVIEECAKIADSAALSMSSYERRRAATIIAENIRALASPRRDRE
jgi:hypothetical protein